MRSLLGILVLTCIAILPYIRRYGGIEEPNCVKYEDYSLRVSQIDVKNLPSSVWFAKTNNPTFYLSITFRNEGSRNFLKTYPGLFGLLSATIFDGAGEYNSSQLKEELTYNDVSININYDFDCMYVTVYSINTNFELAMKILTDILTKAHFRVDKIEVAKQEISEGIRQAQQLPQTIAESEMNKIIYNTNHPYYIEDEKILKNIGNYTRNDILKIYDQTFAPQNAEVVVAGNLNTDVIKKELQKLFDVLSMKKSNKFKSVTQSTDINLPGHTVRVKAKNQQTLVRFALPGIKSDDKDIRALRVALSILGSGLNSRLFKNIREKKGLTYSISCRLLQTEMQSVIIGGASTSAKNCNELVNEIKAQFQELKNNGVTQKELDDYKVSLAVSNTLSSARGIATFLSGCQYNKIPLQDVNSYMQTYYKLTLDEVNNAIKKHILTEKLSFVIVGSNGEKE